MSKKYEDLHITLYNKDCRDMSELADESVQMVCTSPPYWGLRKYAGVPDLIWGSKDCEHRWGIPETKSMEYVQGNPEFARPHRERKNFQSETNTCSLCGAWKGSYGLEPTPEMYIEHTIEILREIRRVLRKDGVVFWNIGDSYYTQPAGNKAPSGFQQKSTAGQVGALAQYGNYKPLPRHDILKPKDLCLIPFRVAIAAQENGWWVRSVIIWSKPNPMPESVTDRPTNSHEYILMLTKSSKYYWDADAVREESHCTSFGADQQDTSITHGIGGGNSGINAAKRRAREQGSFGGRNIRSVWEFPTQPPFIPGKHFASFPEKLPELCIKAATPEVGCCSKCGAPWERVLDKKPSQFNIRVRDTKAGRATPEEGYKATEDEINGYPGNHPDPGHRKTVGWQPTCKCNANKVPSIVLDPFCGSATTLAVAKRLGRHAIGYELSLEYCKLAQNRVEAVTAPFPNLTCP